MIVIAKNTKTPALPINSQATANSENPMILAMISTMSNIFTYERGK